jgi:hypothetical protein
MRTGYIIRIVLEALLESYVDFKKSNDELISQYKKIIKLLEKDKK